MGGNKMGICSRRRMVGRMWVESSGHWRLRREEELGGEKKKHPPGVTP